MRLLRAAFPPDELYNPANHPSGCSYPSSVIYLIDGDEDIGLANIVGKEGDDLVYLAFLMIDEKHRGQGLGSEILRFLKERYPRIFLDIEPLFAGHPDLSIRKKRRDFYRKNGFFETNVTYTFLGLPWLVLSNNEHFETDDFITFWKGVGALPKAGLSLGINP